MTMVCTIYGHQFAWSTLVRELKDYTKNYIRQFWLANIKLQYCSNCGCNASYSSVMQTQFFNEWEMKYMYIYIIIYPLNFHMNLCFLLVWRCQYSNKIQDLNKYKSKCKQIQKKYNICLGDILNNGRGIVIENYSAPRTREISKYFYTLI